MAYKKQMKKFYFAIGFGLLFITIGTIILWTGKLLDDVTLNIFITIFGGYITANIIGKTYKDLKDPPEKTKKKETVIIKSPIDGYKKFIYSIVLGIYSTICITVLKFTDHIIQPNFLKLIAFIYLGFLLGDLAEKYSDFFNKVPNMFSKKKKK